MATICVCHTWVATYVSNPAHNGDNAVGEIAPLRTEYTAPLRQLSKDTHKSWLALARHRPVLDRRFAPFVGPPIHVTASKVLRSVFGNVA